jgi:dCMP deaminase
MRISRPVMLMNMCEVVAQRSTCNRGNIGALIWDPQKNDVVSFGYNGSEAHEPHCLDQGCIISPDHGGCTRAKHAERNAIVKATHKLQGKLNRYHLYCTSSPCETCASLIFNEYVPMLFYRHPYRDKTGLEFLLKSSNMIKIFRVMPNGILISERTGQVIDPRDL